MKKKAFDCVQMKWDIQRKHREEFAGMPEEKQREILAERIEADPILARFLRRARRSATSLPQ
jgi:hypothetical protein